MTEDEIVAYGKAVVESTLNYAASEFKQRAATLRDNFEHEASGLQERYAKDILDWSDSDIAEETLRKFKKDKYR